MKIIFVLGGVISGLGKGVISGSIGATLNEMGYNNITIKKLDPYLNIDPGTMNPLEHGEVYVTKDGGETDLDLGYYERIAEIHTTKNNSVSSGKLLYELLNKERKGEFLGKTIQFIPHFTNMIKNFILKDTDKYDVTICEIGGSVGDSEAMAFMETIRQLKQELGHNNILICMATYIVYYKPSKELKTKPTQVATRLLMEAGIQPDILFTRSEYKMDDDIKNKLALYCNLKKENIIQSIDVPTIYQVPLEYYNEGLYKIISKELNLDIKKNINFSKWSNLLHLINNLKNEVNIGLVGKYVELNDAYYSVLEALNHAGWFYQTKVTIKWINAREPNDMIEQINNCDGIIVPGGFGNTGMEEIINAISYCRSNKKPLFGICLGMQLSVIEFAKNILNIFNASSAEFGNDNDEYIIDIMTEWKSSNGNLEKRDNDTDLGGTMRLGDYPTVIKKKTLAYELYNTTIVNERHRHRYEVNIKYKKLFEENGMIFSGLSPDGNLPEIIELDQKIHPFFIAGQFHPEFNSTPFNPHPLFKGLIKYSLNK